MSENYFDLKKKLEALGYNNVLPYEAVPLVECIFADLLQTTRSLQYYMDLCKEALTQRDKLTLQAEPYRCDNAKLIQENNQLHKNVLTLKEQIDKLSKDSSRSIKSLNEDIKKKDAIIHKLQYEVRELKLQGLCAETLSSRNKSKRKDCGDDNSSRIINCGCIERKVINNDDELLELTQKIKTLEEINDCNTDEISLLRKQVKHRDNEIIRLNILLEGGRPISAINRDLDTNCDSKLQLLLKQLHNVESTNDLLKKEINNGLEKQHEAMLRALSLADKNKYLKDELEKMDKLALRVEEDCNEKLATMLKEVHVLQNKVEQLITKNSQLENQLLQKNVNEPLNIVLKEKEAIQQDVKNLMDLNKNLQERIISVSQSNKEYIQNNVLGKVNETQDVNNVQYATKQDLQNLLEIERKMYEKHMINIQDKLTDAVNLFDKHLYKCLDKEKNTINPSNQFLKDLQNSLCESEQKNLMLKKENEELNNKIHKLQDDSKQNYKDIISQLNVENSELLKENLTLSKQLSQYKHVDRMSDSTEIRKRDCDKIKDDLEKLKCENMLLSKDKQEYNQRYKEALDLVEKLKKDLLLKQKQVDQLEDENCSYRTKTRSGKVSAGRLQDECSYLREQIRKMQTDVIKEKTLANQIKNIQVATERSSNEIQNELLNAHKQLTLSKNEIERLERKCKDLQSEISSLKIDNSNLIDNFKKVDKERDNLVIDLDHKTEAVCAIENKLKSQTYEIEKLEKENVDLKRRLTMNKVSEHKLVDYDAQVRFLNGEISRLTQQLDNAIVENRQLQNTLTDVNGELKLTRIEYGKSRKEVDGVKQQLQHYVAEIRRIEELLSQKEAERSDMLEQFASLSVEANILENTNHSLESESASKSHQLQSYVSKIQNLESKIIDKQRIIEDQATHIATLTSKVTALENEIKPINEEKFILEKNISYLKQMCNNLQSEKSQIVKEVHGTDSELKLYENKIKKLSLEKHQLERENLDVKQNLQSVEKLLNNARKEMIELKLALQDATSETKILKEKMSTQDVAFHETTLLNELESPLEETVHDISHEDREQISHTYETHKRLSKYSHSGTL